jgi:methionine-rich copper-binding protein CopC
MMRATCLLTLAMLFTASQAHAHAFLERALPPVGSQFATPPGQIVLTFTEGIEPLFSTIELRDAQNIAVATGTPRTEPDNNRKLVIDLPVLRGGRYTVIWHATSVDTHKTEGSYQFTVAP